MRKSALIAFAFSAVVTSTSMLYGQTASPQNFPWRTQSGVQPVVLPDLFPSRSATAPARATAPAAVRAPVTAGSPLSGQATVSKGLFWRTPSGVQPVVMPDLFPGSTVQPAPAPVETNRLRLPKTTVPTETPSAKMLAAEMLATEMLATETPLTEMPLSAERFTETPLTALPFMQTEPAPAKTKRKPFLVSFRKRQEPLLSDSQPSVSDISQPVIDISQSVVEVPEEVPGIVTLAAPPQGLSPGFPTEPTLVVESNASDDETDYCCRDCTPDHCDLGCERKLFGETCNGLQVGGWLSLGYYNRDNILFNNRKSEANLNQTWLYFDKSASRDSCNWSMGYRADLFYGIDAQDAQAFGNPPTGAPAGWDNSWDFGSHGWALPQAYVQFANADWDVKVGKFWSPFGYEVVPSPENFFYSHSYTMYNTEPFTLSGVLAERRISDTRSIVLGATAGWDTGFDNNTGGVGILGTRYRPNEYIDWALTTSYGDTGYRDTGTMTSAVAQIQLTDEFKYVFQADSLNLKTNQEFGIVQYLFRDVNPCLGLGARLEWWKSDRFFDNTKSTYNFTVGANYRKNANLTFRPELRFDWGAAAIDPGTPIIGFDAIMTF